MVFFYRQIDSLPKEEAKIPDDLRVRVRRPASYVEGMSEMNLGRWMKELYSRQTFRSKGLLRTFKEFDLMRGDKILCKALLISKIPEYEFLPSDGVHLCYCETASDERGKGYYPMLLRHIRARYPRKDLHVIVYEDNTASIKGIEKAGFIRYAEGRKTSDGRFVITTRYFPE